MYPKDLDQHKIESKYTNIIK